MCNWLLSPLNEEENNIEIALNYGIIFISKMAALRSKSRSFLEAIPRCFCGGNYLLSTLRYRLYSNYQTQEKSTHFGFEEVSEQEKTQKGRQDQRSWFFFASQMCKFPSFRCQITIPTPLRSRMDSQSLFICNTLLLAYYVDKHDFFKNKTCMPYHSSEMLWSSYSDLYKYVSGTSLQNLATTCMIFYPKSSIYMLELQLWQCKK